MLSTGLGTKGAATPALPRFRRGTTMRVVGAQWWERDGGLRTGRLDDRTARPHRCSQPDGRVRASSVKIMVDGVAEISPPRWLAVPGCLGRATDSGSLFIRRGT
ncbi:MAG: hypothetical protein KF739_07480 [Cryobacterium sp.]|nr:hypothetical protein [Cryobacterium sp.]